MGTCGSAPEGGRGGGGGGRAGAPALTKEQLPERPIETRASPPGRSIRGQPPSTFDDQVKHAADLKQREESAAERFGAATGEERAAALCVLRSYRTWRAGVHRRRHRGGRHTYGGPPPASVFEAGMLHSVWRHLDFASEQETTHDAASVAGSDDGEGEAAIAAAIDAPPPSHPELPSGRWRRADVVALMSRMRSADSKAGLDVAYVEGVLRDAEKLFAGQSTVEQMPLGKDPGSKCVVVGDLHGQVVDLLYILAVHGLPSPEASDPAASQVDRGVGDTSYVFNGDLVDRGSSSTEVLCLVLALALAFPSSVRVNRGNHEDNAQAKKYGFRSEIVGGKYSVAEGERIYGHTLRVFHALPLCCIVAREVLVVHGGLPREACSLEKLNALDRKRGIPLGSTLPADVFFTDMLWSDPSDEVEGVKVNSQRGAGVLFGEHHTRTFLAANPPLKSVIRSHEPPPLGWSRQQADAVYTVFSASDYRGSSSNKAAVLVVTHDPGANRVDVTPVTWTADLAFAKLSGTQYRFLAPRPKLSSDDKLEWTRDEVLRKLRERASLLKSELLSAFQDADTDDDGLLTHLEWDGVMRRVLIPVPWTHLRRYMVPLRDTVRDARVPASLLLGSDPSVKVASHLTTGADGSKSVTSVFFTKVPASVARTGLHPSTQVVTAGGRQVESTEDVVKAAEACGSGDLDVQVRAHRIPFMDMIVNCTCGMEEDLAFKWAPYFMRWLLDRASEEGDDAAAAAAGNRMFVSIRADLADKTRLSFREFSEMIAGITLVATGDHVSASLPQWLQFHVYRYLAGLAPGSNGAYLQKEAWDEAVRVAVDGSESYRPLVIKTFATTQGQRKEHPFLMWDVWILHSLRTAFSEIQDVLSAFRFADSDRDCMVGVDDMREAVRALRLQGEKGRGTEWTQRVRVDQPLPDQELRRLFGHVPVAEHDGFSWVRLERAGKLGWVRADHVEVCEDGSVVFRRKASSPERKAAVRMQPSGEAYAFAWIKKDDPEPSTFKGMQYTAKVFPPSDDQLRSLIRRIQHASGHPLWKPGDNVHVQAERREPQWFDAEEQGRAGTVREVAADGVTVVWRDDGTAEKLPPSVLRRECKVTYVEFVRAFYSTSSLASAAASTQGVAAGPAGLPWFAEDDTLWEVWRKLPRALAEGDGKE